LTEFEENSKSLEEKFIGIERDSRRFLSRVSFSRRERRTNFPHPVLDLVVGVHVCKNSTSPATVVFLVSQTPRKVRQLAAGPDCRGHVVWADGHATVIQFESCVVRGRRMRLGIPVVKIDSIRFDIV
jgi:hypothetical protein